MKLMFCQDCGDLVVPSGAAMHPLHCACMRHAVWWVNPQLGTLRLNDRRHFPREDSESVYKYFPKEPRAYIIGLSNMLFNYPAKITAKPTQELIDLHEDSYLFKQYRSLVIRIRPGESGDTSWDQLPNASGV